MDTSLGDASGNPTSAERRSEWDPTLYDEKHSFIWENGAEVVDLLAPKKGERILDIGCGTGHLTARIAALGASVVGIDPSMAMLERARTLYPALQLVQASVEELTTADPFDAVFSNATIHWIKRPETVIAAIAGMLKPGGRFVAEFGSKGNLTTVSLAVDRACREILGKPFASPWYFPSMGEYATLLERHGLDCVFCRQASRSIPLEGENRVRQWLRMYLSDTLDQIPTSRMEEFFNMVESFARPFLYREGTWWMDHRRLRIVAVKPHP